jgi:alkanesulfonate monooxygenase SsuD/methylene tetrahydromethanopterin reductase-like flavin-dependent oxidoreductase (luciferase family)
MNLWFFSEAAYPDLPPEDTYPSVRVTLPNAVLDPVKAADWWDEYLEEWRAASCLGINVMLNEHHSTATCMNAAVPIVAGIMARETCGCRILILGNPIANRKDPVRVAEEMAMLDVFSRGRLEVGFVRGVPYEISATNTDPTRMFERFWEAHDLIKKAWTTHDGPFSWQGRFFEHRQVNIWPRPYQDPHPPIWITAGSPGSAMPIGERGYVLATFLSGLGQTAKIFDGYREGWSRTHDEEAPADRLAYAALVFVGETDEEGLAGAEKLMWYVTANKVPSHLSTPPGYIAPEFRAMAAKGEISKYAMRGKSVEAMVERGVVFAGSSDTVAAQIKRFQDQVGAFGNLLIMGQAGFLRKDDVIASLTRMAKEVLPRLESAEKAVAVDRLA